MNTRGFGSNLFVRCCGTFWLVSYFLSPNCHISSRPFTFPSCLLKTNNKPVVADINGRDENPGAISAGIAWANLPQPALYRQQHLSLSIIWLLSQQINQIIAPGQCMQLLLMASLVALPLKCMRSAFYHCYLFRMPLPPLRITLQPQQSWIIKGTTWNTHWWKTLQNKQEKGEGLG